MKHEQFHHDSNRYRRYLYEIRFTLLLVVLIIMIVVPGFFEERTVRDIVWPLVRTLLLLSCLNVIQKMKKVAIVTAVIGILATSFDWIQQIDTVHPNLGLAGLCLFSLFIGIVSYELFNQLLKTKYVSMHMIIAAFDGFLLIGIAGLLMFIFIHYLSPGSFSNVPTGEAGIDDLLYYSYITLLTIGYGDIVPISQAAKRLSILMGLIGQFYLVIVMSVMVGKFLTRTRV